jgi:hypothetical protein
MRDTNAVVREANPDADVHAYTGLVSSLGVLLWCTGAAITVFTALKLRSWNRDRERAGFLLAAGVFTAVLALDDLFQIHEGLAFLLDLPDVVVLAVYVGLCGALLFRWRREVRHTEYGLLGIALTCFAASLVVDALDPKELVNRWIGPRYHLIEDGFKLLGIAMWTTYFTRVGWRGLKP